jgi:uncharacterized membrane protein required for colicin V production
VNAYDWIIIVLWVLLLAWGMRTGFVRALFAGITIFIAFIVTGRITPAISSVLTTSDLSEAIGDSIIYWVTFAIVLFGANWLLGYVQRVVNFAMTILLLGPIDKLAGLAIGAVLGLIVTMAFIMTTASYAIGNVPLPDDRFAGQERAAGQLANSTIVPWYVTLWDVLPADAFGVVPEAYASAMNDLDGVIEFSDITGALTGDEVLGFLRDRVSQTE